MKMKDPTIQESPEEIKRKAILNDLRVISWEQFEDNCMQEARECYDHEDYDEGGVTIDRLIEYYKAILMFANDHKMMKEVDRISDKIIFLHGVRMHNYHKEIGAI